MHVHVVEGYCLVAIGNDVGCVDQVGVVVDLVDLVGMVLSLVVLDNSLRGPLLRAERRAGETGRDGGHDHHAQQ